MRKVFKLCIGAAVVMSAEGCTQVPYLDSAEEGARIVDVVKRVKCDIYEAFSTVDPKGRDVLIPLSDLDDHRWLKNWTAQVDLNLVVNNQSGITPGVTIVDPLHQVAIPRVGTFSQSFSLGLGGGANTTAARTETITFSLSVAEIDKELRGNPSKSAFERACRLADGIGLRSELRLKEWIKSSLAPVRDQALTVGHHKSPKGSAGGGQKSAGRARSSTSSLFAASLTDLKLERGNGIPIASALRAINDVTKQIMDLKNDATTADLIELNERIKEVIKQLDSVINLIETNRTDPDIQEAAKLHKKTVDELVEHFRLSKFALSWTRKINVLSQNKYPTQAEILALMEQLDKDIATVQRSRNKETARAVIKVLRHAKDALTDTLADFDPPIDSISHQVQFIVAFNANTSPSWTLVRFKGPSPGSGGLISGSHSNTHTLSIVLGSPGEVAGKLNALQVGTSIGTALNTATVKVTPVQ